MKLHTILFISAAFSCCVLSCDFSDNSTKQNKKPETDSGDLSIYAAIYKMEVVNNTDSAISVRLGTFYIDDDPYHIAPFDNNELCTIPGNTTDTVEFYWGPRERLDYPENFSPDTQWPTVEEMKARFHPCISSFFLRIRIDDAEYYLAGWPQSVSLPHLLTNPDYDGFVIDTGKIVQYGIGYGNIKEVRVNEFDIVYNPFIISYVQDGQTEVCDFDEAEIVYGKTVLTIDAPDKITFQTLSLSLFTDD